jgi:hypothetical protein
MFAEPTNDIKTCKHDDPSSFRNVRIKRLARFEVVIVGATISS